MSEQTPRTEPGTDVPDQAPEVLADDAAEVAATVDADSGSAAGTAADAAGTGADAPAPAGAGQDDQAGAGPAAADGSVAADPLAEALALADARLLDLQRERADFVNYRRRVERDRELAGVDARGAVLTALLPVLDDIEGARTHGDLTGPFLSVAEKLQASLSRLGLEPFGEVGEPFDPALHEALLQDSATEVSEPTCTQVLQRGYRVGDRVLRPARVAVASP